MGMKIYRDKESGKFLLFVYEVNSSWIRKKLVMHFIYQIKGSLSHPIKLASLSHFWFSRVGYKLFIYG